ncbi:sensor histidine kinase [Myroides odoratimimus]|uniref:sensor histidine kinase n=1 Tax=Myroides odoratimimus TaxID=76832 RepID=UPI0038D497BA
MNNIKRVLLICLGSLFFVLGCNDQKENYKIDLDNLYAFKRTKYQKDSISNKYSKTALKIFQADNTLNKSLLIDSLISKLRWGSDTTTFFKLVNIAKQDAKKKYDSKRLARLYESLAVFYHDEQSLDSVYSYYLKAEQIHRKNNNNLALAENLYYQARLLYEIGFYNESKEKLYKAIKELQDYPNSPISIEANQMKVYYQFSEDNNQRNDQEIEELQNIYHTLKNDENKYKILPKSKFVLAISNLCANIAQACLMHGKLEKAKLFCLKGLTYVNELENNQVQTHLKWLYYDILYYQGQKEGYIENLLKIHSEYIKLNHPYFIIEISIHISNVYLEQGQSDKSLKWLLDAYILTKQNKFFIQQRIIIEEILKNHPNYQTQELVQELIEVSYLLEQQQNKMKESFAKIESDVIVLEKENIFLNQKIHVISLISILSIVSLIYLLIVLQLKAKNKELKIANVLQVQNEKVLKLFLEKTKVEETAILNERNRIAKDLHDGVINSIFTLRFNTQLLEISNVEYKNKLINELIELENTIRNISHSLSLKNKFENKSFEKLLNDLVNKQTNKNHTHYSFECHVNIECLTILEKINIYQIIQEAFQNVNKHAFASTCILRIKKHQSHIVFSIEDNGIGIKSKISKGIGLKNMKERAENILATLNIDSEYQRGTKVVLTINIKNI